MKKLFLLSLMALAIQSQAQNVGIGTPTPAFAYKLHVHSSTFPDASIGITNNFTTDANLRDARLRMFDSDFSIFNYEISGKMNFVTNSSTRMVIGSNGYVGIGNHEPTYVLDVRNNIRGSLFLENPVTNFNSIVRIL